MTSARQFGDMFANFELCIDALNVVVLNVAPPLDRSSSSPLYSQSDALILNVDGFRYANDERAQRSADDNDEPRSTDDNDDDDNANADAAATSSDALVRKRVTFRSISVAARRRARVASPLFAYVALPDDGAAIAFPRVDVATTTANATRSRSARGVVSVDVAVGGASLRPLSSSL